MSTGARPTWRTSGVVAAVALIALAAVDVLGGLVAPRRLLREVEDATSDYRGADPTVLVIGSSHSRTFDILGEVLQERTRGRERLLAVAVEWGKLTSFEWVLEHRLKPFIEERDQAGTPRRPSLRQVLLVTESWDARAYRTGESALNLPARAWEMPEFLADAWDNGFTPYNRNYLSNRFRRLLRFSSLVVDRGYERILMNIQRRLKPPTPEFLQAEYQRHLQGWQRETEAAAGQVGDPGQLAALDRMAAYFRGRGLPVTIVLYPLMPGTLTEKARATTLRQYSDLIRARGEAAGARVVDLSWGTPMQDSDYQEDFEHMTREGGRKFSEWALDGPLGFLLGGTP
jgi:hypothetical protein